MEISWPARYSSICNEQSATSGSIAPVYDPDDDDQSKEKDMQVTAWKGGVGEWSSATYGVRIGKGNRDKFFSDTWHTVILRLEGARAPVEVKITSGFWRNCPELRSKEIGHWFQKNGLVPWTKSHPPAMTLEPDMD
jgi:hypothetical protein